MNTQANDLPAFFVTGTDTGVGKTHVSCAFVRAARAAGHIVTGYKPIAAGAEFIDGQYSNEDARQLQAAGSPGFTLNEINPLCLRAAMAPHIAAERESRRIDLAGLLQGFQALQTHAKRIVVEGAGGFLVPLDDQYDSGDLVLALNLPVVLVVGIRLGCLNHALLSAEAIRSRGLRLAGWVANHLSADMPGAAENVTALRSRLQAPLLGELPWQTDPSTIQGTQTLQWPQF